MLEPSRHPVPRVSVADVTRWSLTHLDAHRAALIGVEPRHHAAEFHVVPLRCDDPIGDVTGLVIPSTWPLRVVVGDGVLLGHPGWARIAFGFGAGDERHVCFRRADGRTWEVPLSP